MKAKDVKIGNLLRLTADGYHVAGVEVLRVEQICQIDPCLLKFQGRVFHLGNRQEYLEYTGEEKAIVIHATADVKIFLAEGSDDKNL